MVSFKATIDISCQVLLCFNSAKIGSSLSGEVGNLSVAAAAGGESLPQFQDQKKNDLRFVRKNIWDPIKLVSEC